MDELPANIELLTLLVLGDLNPEEAAALQKEVDRSPEARAVVDHLRAMIQTLRTDDSVTPSREVVERAVAISSTKHPSLVDRLSETVAMVATLVFDSRGQAALAGFRGGMTGHQMAYSCPVAEIDLQVSPPGASGGAWTVRGALDVGPDADDGVGFLRVGLVRPESRELVCEAPVDGKGGFKLHAPPGVFDLVIETSEDIITVERIGLQ